MRLIRAVIRIELEHKVVVSHEAARRVDTFEGDTGVVAQDGVANVGSWSRGEGSGSIACCNDVGLVKCLGKSQNSGVV